MLTRAEKFMQLALKQAQYAFDKGEVPIGAVIVYNDKVIARGYNLRNTKKSSLYHAEIIAIQKACKKINDWRLEDCEMFVTVEPCPMCAGAIIQSRMKKVYYGAKNSKAGSIDSIVKLLDIDSYNHKVESESGILETKSQMLMTQFFKELRLNKGSKNN